VLCSFPASYEVVSKGFRTGRLERELQMVQLSASRCSCIAILRVSLVSFAAITLRVASQLVFIAVSVYFIIDSVRNFWTRPRISPRGDVVISNCGNTRLLSGKLRNMSDAKKRMMTNRTTVYLMHRPTFSRRRIELG
jgi:hypothetical protein